jgi:hypothetical protein
MKNEIAKMKQLEKLVEMINIIIYINNQVYKRQMKRTKDKASFQP